MLDDASKSDLIKALFGFDAIVGNYASPYAPGSAYVLLHHVFGEVNGKKGVWGHAIGGMGAITQAMATAAARHGVEIETTQACARSLSRESRQQVSCSTTDGRSAQDMSRRTSTQNCCIRGCCPPDALPADLSEPHQDWRNGSGTFRMNVALSALPSFSALPGAGDHLSAGIIIAPGLDYMDSAWQDARQFGWSREPVIEVLIPSVIDDSLAPPGRHVASLFCQHVAPQLPTARPGTTIAKRSPTS